MRREKRLGPFHQARSTVVKVDSRRLSSYNPFMRPIFALIALLMFPSLAEATHAIYRITEYHKLTGLGYYSEVTIRGFLVFDPDTGRGTAIGGYQDEDSKKFLVETLEKFRIYQVNGPDGASYTIIVKALRSGEANDTAETLLDFSYAKGRNEQITLDATGARNLPRVFRSRGNGIIRSIEFNEVLEDQNRGTSVLDEAASITSNQSETFEQAVARIKRSFLKRGFVRES